MATSAEGHLLLESIAQKLPVISWRASKQLRGMQKKREIVPMIARVSRKRWGKRIEVQVPRDIFIRRVSTIHGENGNGSEYWMIDVVNRVSQVQHNGTSLHNSANADAISALVDEGVAKRSEPSRTFRAGLIHRSDRRGHPRDRSEDVG